MGLTLKAIALATILDCHVDGEYVGEAVGR